MLFFAWIGAGLGLCKARNDAEAEDAKSKGGGRPVRPKAHLDVVRPFNNPATSPASASSWERGSLGRIKNLMSRNSLSSITSITSLTSKNLNFKL